MGTVVGAVICAMVGDVGDAVVGVGVDAVVTSVVAVGCCCGCWCCCRGRSVVCIGCVVCVCCVLVCVVVVVGVCVFSCCCLVIVALVDRVVGKMDVGDFGCWVTSRYVTDKRGNGQTEKLG